MMKFLQSISAWLAKWTPLFIAGVAVGTYFAWTLVRVRVAFRLWRAPRGRLQRGGCAGGEKGVSRERLTYLPEGML